ncbi:MAG: 2-dehydro-3-deoxyphosphogluconate aldolase [Oscillospiraceae bacterium]|jgi:2-dehydro-3-deoxyphosphogluconate aldolase/(4S)-4-hydroxy-2-oxoglutarate aldolase|nr:2-dehydro-3-deoxyphosphogluconate aldolase [Oscillospiraceae bacterium]
MRETVLEWVAREKVVAIVRGAESSVCTRVAEALYAGGIRLMEITYDQRSPESWEDTAAAIGQTARRFEGRMLVGAGTVTEPGLVELTHRAGGCFIISPDTNEAVIRRTRELDMVSMPGAMTPTEILTAHRAGADFVKLFPAAGLGPAYLRAVCAPLSHVKIMVVGGIDEKNVGAFLAAGAAGAGVGGNLANRQWIRDGAWDKITQAARLLTGAVRQS